MAAPKTIEEFKQLAAEKQLPLKKMRFFLGEDCKEAKCFGIYHDEARDRYVVYKNKADGTRAIRYEGPDEAEACHILYDKMASEIQLRRDKAQLNRQADRVDAAARASSGRKKKGFDWSFLWITALMAAIIGGVVWYAVQEPTQGYYHRDDEVYYYCNDSWYWYDDGLWLVLDAVEDGMSDYWYGKTDEQFTEETCFESTDYYVPAGDAYDSDSWSSSDFSDWSSSDTDWSSDW